jgi:hypothetical protein
VGTEFPDGSQDEIPYTAVSAPDDLTNLAGVWMLRKKPLSFAVNSDKAFSIPCYSHRAASPVRLWRNWHTRWA